MKNDFKVIAGVFLLIIGTLLLIDRTAFLLPFSINIRQILSIFWPLVIIAFGVKLLSDKNITWGVIISLFGFVILFTNTFNWNFFAILWPLVIIGIGISILFKKEGSSFSSSSSKVGDNRIEESFSFTDSSRTITSQSFTGGRVNLSFGELELDLREAKISSKNAKLNVSAAFGEIKVFVPKNCRVVTKGSSFLGSWEPKLENSTVEKPVLEITGNAFLGEITITN